MIPHHIPALKIPSINEQLLNNEVVRASAKNPIYLFIVSVFSILNNFKKIMFDFGVFRGGNGSLRYFWSPKVTKPTKELRDTNPNVTFEAQK